MELLLHSQTYTDAILFLLQIAETYAFLPREAVTRFLMSCTECQKRMHFNANGLEPKGKTGLSGSPLAGGVKYAASLNCVLTDRQIQVNAALLLLPKRANSCSHLGGDTFPLWLALGSQQVRHPCFASSSHCSGSPAAEVAAGWRRPHSFTVCKKMN